MSVTTLLMSIAASINKAKPRNLSRNFSSYSKVSLRKSQKPLNVALKASELNFPRRTSPSFVRYTSSANSLPSVKDSKNSNANSIIARQPEIDWDDFFRLRKKRRLYQQFFSFGTGLGGVMGGVQILMHSNIDALLSISPIILDPIIGLGLITFTCGGLGWLMGPIAGTALFNLTTQEYRARLDEREREFFKRVRKYRVDPSTSSMANPVPDYYGEKIYSVQGYRQWLKDCRAYNKKRTTYLS
ncbi:Presequence translocated-associated motor subunit pam17, mitochondrial [Golovinomyces cichoracearum]|uniref:Presequence translocated-associated motor subunit PAM17 n=1 Tax=Golovinomyces cichoracearum TaxID=62708 RepID=A0A420IG32_9PEZI|nr:Presequence translocated-associated motor subunit pam17, mitochondrial [Golovinomyces cichoracearum]